MKRLSWIIVVPVAVVAVTFAIRNRTQVIIDLWPLPWQIEAGTYLILLGALVTGILLGLFLSWASSGPKRRRMRQYVQANERQAAEIRDLRKQLTDAKRAAAETVTVTPLPGTGMPVIVDATSLPATPQRDAGQ